MKLPHEIQPTGYPSLRSFLAKFQSKLKSNWGCRETNALKAAVEQSKNEVLRYSLSLILALVAAGLTAARVLPDFSKK